MEQAPHSWGTILCIIPLHISYKYPYLPLVHSLGQEDMKSTLNTMNSAPLLSAYLGDHSQENTSYGA